MDWLEEVGQRQKKKNQVLFRKDSEYLWDLRMLLEGQSHTAAILWALDLAEETVELLKERYPEETRPEQALIAARDWAAGNVKMRFAQRKILDCHAAAKELASQEDIALCHAVGQACAVVHTAGHAIGYPMYELTALVCRYGLEDCTEFVEARKREYISRLFYWAEHERDEARTWAAFLTE